MSARPTEDKFACSGGSLRRAGLDFLSLQFQNPTATNSLAALVASATVAFNVESASGRVERLAVTSGDGRNLLPIVAFRQRRLSQYFG
jgi:hypothetical protein